MLKTVILLAAFMALTIASVWPVTAAPAHDSVEGETVVLLHGLTRTRSSMLFLKYRLSQQGYRVIDISYPSRHLPPAELVANVDGQLRAHGLDGEDNIHFVTHSLGGLIVRGLATEGWGQKFGRVVMLGPPNHGSELVDRFRAHDIFGLVYGATGRSLGTQYNAWPQQLGNAQFEFGVIAGNRSINPVGSALLPGADDGVVSVEAMKLDGMNDFIVMPANHTTLIINSAVADQAIAFLKRGRFRRDVETGIQILTPRAL